MKAAIYCRVSTDNQNVVAQFIGLASSVITRSVAVARRSRSEPNEIPRLRFGTGSATSPLSLRRVPTCRDDEAISVEGIGIATDQTGIRYPIPVDLRREPLFPGQLKDAASRAGK
jgi:hypothetical protein